MVEVRDSGLEQKELGGSSRMDARRWSHQRGRPCRCCERGKEHNRAHREEEEGKLHERTKSSVLRGLAQSSAKQRGQGTAAFLSMTFFLQNPVVTEEDESVSVDRRRYTWGKLDFMFPLYDRKMLTPLDLKYRCKTESFSPQTN